jgi:hypothetical protein
VVRLTADEHHRIEVPMLASGIPSQEAIEVSPPSTSKGAGSSTAPDGAFIPAEATRAGPYLVVNGAGVPTLLAGGSQPAARSGRTVRGRWP